MSTKKTPAKAAAPTGNATDLAKQLYSKLTTGKKAEPKKADAKAKRPALPLTDAEKLNLKRFAAAYSVSKEVEARRDNEKAFLNTTCLNKWVDELWKTKNRPPTQFLSVDNADGKPDVTANFIVSDKYSFNMPEVKEDETLAEAFTRKFVEIFTATGMDENEADAAAVSLVNSELDLAQRPHIDLFKWLVGHYEGEGENKVFKDASEEEKALGVKVLTNLQCRDKNSFIPLTDEEFATLVETKNHLDVKKGFLQRVCSYVKSVDQLKAVFTVIKPIVWPGQVKFGVSDNLSERNNRMWMEAKDILGVS